MPRKSKLEVDRDWSLSVDAASAGPLSLYVIMMTSMQVGYRVVRRFVVLYTNEYLSFYDYVTTQEYRLKRI